MKERPILFQGPMVRAILEGRKMQTRRITKPHIAAMLDDREARGCEPLTIRDEQATVQPDNSIARVERQVGVACSVGCDLPDDDTILSMCPYGVPGDQLWVRETFADLTEHMGTRWQRFNCETGRYERGVKPYIWYRADGEQPDPGNGVPIGEPWRPSIHMPRWASRITLEITGVRVERLQKTSEEDAEAEGIERIGGAASVEPWKNYLPGGRPCSAPSTSFSTLWESINGRGSWDANPWVWVVEFERMEAAHG